MKIQIGKSQLPLQGNRPFPFNTMIVENKSRECNQTEEYPQPEKGYARISNELLEALASTKLNTAETRLIFAIARKTYGWNKSTDWIAVSQFVKMTGMTDSQVCHVKKRLIERKIIVQIDNQICWNEFHTQWRQLPKQTTKTKLSEQTTDLPVQTKSLSDQAMPLPEQTDTKETITKDTYTKNNTTKDSDANASMFFCEKNNKKSCTTKTTVIDSLEMEYRTFLLGVSQILKNKEFTVKGMTKYRARRKTFTLERLCAAFENLLREPDHWKIANNAWRPMDWWLKSDDYIIELEHVHEKTVKGNSRIAVFIPQI